MFNSQVIIDNFKGEIKVESEIEHINPTPDEHITVLNTNKGIYYLLSLDYFSDFEYIEEVLQSYAGKYSKFIPVEDPKDKFEDLHASRFYTSKDHFPPNFNKFNKFVYCGYKSIYFNFLVKK